MGRSWLRRLLADDTGFVRITFDKRHERVFRVPALRFAATKVGHQFRHIVVTLPRHGFTVAVDLSDDFVFRPHQPEHPLESVNHGYVITGSSNFSHSGLEGNLEFNVLLAEPEEHDYALHRFNEL